MRHGVLVITGFIAAVASGCSLLWPFDSLQGGASTATDGGSSDASVTGRPRWAPCADVGWCDLGAKTTLDSVAPGNTSAFAYQDNVHRIFDFGSAIADTDDNILVLWAGSFEYAGNEVYTLRLDDTPRMERRSDPSAFEDCSPVLKDGKPSGRATYDALTYLPEQRAMFAFAGEYYCTSANKTDPSTWLLDLRGIASSTWQPMWSKKASPPPNLALLGPVSDYDPISKRVLVHATNDLFAYEPASDRFEVVQSEPLHYHVTGRVDPKRGAFVVVGCHGCDGGSANPRAGLMIFRPAGAGYRVEHRTDEALATCGPLLTAPAPGLAYDPVFDRFVGWPNQGSKIYLLDIESATCEVVEFKGGPTARDPSKRFTRGRFRYFPARGVFIALPDPDGPAYALRLPEKR